MHPKYEQKWPVQPMNGQTAAIRYLRSIKPKKARPLTKCRRKRRKREQTKLTIYSVSNLTLHIVIHSLLLPGMSCPTSAVLNIMCMQRPHICIPCSHALNHESCIGTLQFGCRMFQLSSVKSVPIQPSFLGRLSRFASDHDRTHLLSPTASAFS